MSNVVAVNSSVVSPYSCGYLSRRAYYSYSADEQKAKSMIITPYTYCINLSRQRFLQTLFIKTDSPS